MADSPFLAFWLDLTDIAVATVLIWGALWWLRRTRALAAFLGLAILASVYLGARQLGLQLTAWMFQGFSAVLLILIVVVFQDDLRRLLEQIGAWGLRRRQGAPAVETTDAVVRAVARMVHTRTGALVVLPGREPLERLLDGGVELNGRVSEPLLLSLFDHHSPGHDGAAVVTGGRVTRFAVHLPLSIDARQLGNRGTRHAAALGLAERSDALCVVVSEERGTVSVAQRGVLRVLDAPKDLAPVLRSFAAELSPTPRTGWSRLGAVVHGWPQFLAALGLACGLWLVLVPGSTVAETTRQVRVAMENLPPGYLLEAVEPDRVTVTVAGPRRKIYFGTPDMIQVKVDGLLAQLGRRTFPVGPENVQRPADLEVVAVNPNQVRVSLRKIEAPPAAPPGAATPLE